MKKAFTLLELIVVVIILGILVSIAIPTFRVSMEKARAAEGIRILGDLRRAQIRYYTQYEVYTEELDSLDILIPSSSRRFFGSIYASIPVEPSYEVGIVRRNIDSPYGRYLLYITLDGTIYCSNSTNNFCEGLGYPPLP